MTSWQDHDSAHEQLPRRSTALKRKHYPFFNPGTIAVLVGFAVVFFTWCPATIKNDINDNLN